MVRFKHSKSCRLTTLFEGESELSDFSGSLQDALGRLFPERKTFFADKDHSSLTVQFRSGLPFGPSPEDIHQTLFPELEQDAARVVERFDLSKLVLAGIETGGLISGDRTTTTSKGEYYSALRGGRGIVLSAAEFKALTRLAREGKASRNIILSVFIDPDRIFSYYLPSSILLARVFEDEKEISDHIASGPDIKVYDPITGIELDPAARTAGGGSGLVAFSGSGYVLAPSVKGMFGFPWFGSTMSMRAGESSIARAYPCSNCCECVNSCPSRIEPSYLYHLAQAEEDDEALALGLERCVRCGICSLVCPANIPLYDGIIRALGRTAEEMEEEKTG